MSIGQAFQQLTGRQPTDADKARLRDVARALNLKDNDALWVVLLALHDYETRYETMPKRIEEAAAKAVQEARTAAQDETGKAIAAGQKQLAVAMRKAAEKVAEDTASAVSRKWMAIAFATAFVTISAAMGLGYYIGNM